MNHARKRFYDENQSVSSDGRSFFIATGGAPKSAFRRTSELDARKKRSHEGDHCGDRPGDKEKLRRVREKSEGFF